MEFAKLSHNDKIVLENMRYATSMYEISKGLMFSGRKKIKQGMCLVMPTEKDVKFGASVTMFFCFSSMEIIFVTSEFKVIDKIILMPFKASYTPKEKCRYVIESKIGTFYNIKIGDIVKIEK